MAWIFLGCRGHSLDPSSFARQLVSCGRREDVTVDFLEILLNSLRLGSKIPDANGRISEPSTVAVVERCITWCNPHTQLEVPCTYKYVCTVLHLCPKKWYLLQWIYRMCLCQCLANSLLTCKCLKRTLCEGYLILPMWRPFSSFLPPIILSNQSDWGEAWILTSQTSPSCTDDTEWRLIYLCSWPLGMMDKTLNPIEPGIMISPWFWWSYNRLCSRPCR